MHIALTGVSGFLGFYIAKRCHESGHTLTGLVRETSRREHVEPYVDRYVVGDHADESKWEELFDGADCVIHNSVNWDPLKSSSPDLELHFRSNLNPSIKMIHAAAPRQFIFVSTIAVHYDMRPRWQGKVDEDHPLRPGTLYGAYKAAVEAHLWHAHFQSGQNTCAMRPCGVYGLDPNIERSYGINLVRKVHGGAKRVRKKGGGKFVHVEDVASAVVGAVGNENVSGRAFNLVDCYARWADWAQMTATLLGRQDLEIDCSSPKDPQNQFSKKAAQEILGVRLDRGHEGIAEYLKSLAEAVV